MTEATVKEPALATTNEAGGAFDHGARSRFNAWFFRAFDRYINRLSRGHKEAAFGGLERGKVLEIGAGVGANLEYMSPGTELIAVEPNLRMHEALRGRCGLAGIDLTIVSGGAESIPLPDGSVDEVICSLVLCTVEDPERVLAEIRRVLAPADAFASSSTLPPRAAGCAASSSGSSAGRGGGSSKGATLARTRSRSWRPPASTICGSSTESSGARCSCP